MLDKSRNNTMTDIEIKNKAILDSLGIHNIVLFREELNTTIPNNPNITFFYSTNTSVYTIKKTLSAVVNLTDDTIEYHVSMKADVDPCNIEPHGETIFSELYQKKEDAINAYNQLTLDSDRCWRNVEKSTQNDLNILRIHNQNQSVAI